MAPALLHLRSRGRSLRVIQDRRGRRAVGRPQFCAGANRRRQPQSTAPARRSDRDRRPGRDRHHPSCLPPKNNRHLRRISAIMATRCFALGKFAINDHRTASTELGGLAHLTPVIHPYVVATEGPRLAGIGLSLSRLGFPDPRRIAGNDRDRPAARRCRAGPATLAKVAPTTTKDADPAVQRGLFNKAPLRSGRGSIRPGFGPDRRLGPDRRCLLGPGRPLGARSSLGPVACSAPRWDSPLVSAAACY